MDNRRNWLWKLSFRPSRWCIEGGRSFMTMRGRQS
jgi:hypothetical protein